MNLGDSPLNSQCGPSQRTRGGDRSGVAQSIAKRRGVRRKSIRVREIGGKLEPGVLAELHKETEIVSEGKLQVATGDGGLERLLHCLLCMESHWRIGNPFVLVQGFRRGEILTGQGQQVAGKVWALAHPARTRPCERAAWTRPPRTPRQRS